MTVHTTACPRNCYSTCAMRVTVEDGRLVAVEPHPANRATAEGPCLKGLSYVERQHSPERLLHPLRRTADGSFQRVSWDEALGELAERLQMVRDTHGPRAVFHYAGSGTKGLLNDCSLAFWRRFGGCTTTYGDLCWPAGLEAARLTLGQNIHNAPWDLANARLILLWGKNPAETNIHQQVFINQALDNGARLVVIDPRRTESAERAELLIQPRPGTDGFLALAVARLLVERGGVDEVFVREKVLGFRRFASMVRELDLDQAARTCGVPIPAMEKLAGLLASIRPATLCAGYGMQRYTNSGQTMRALLSLPVITGNIGKPGGGWVYANLQTHVFGGPRDPVACFPPESDDGPVRVSVSTARLGRDMLAQRDPPLKLAWVERGNPLAQNPQTGLVREAFRNLDFRVVVDQFLTDTAREADLVLPARTMFEQTDVIGAYWHHYLQLRPRIIDPPGEVRPETEIFRDLALRLNIDGAGPDGGALADEIPGPGDQEVRAWLEKRLGTIGLSLVDFDDGAVAAPGSVDVVFADGVFATPSGKIELYSGEAVQRWNVDPLPRCTLPEESAARPESSQDTPLQLLTPNTKNRIHSQFGNLELIRARESGPELQMHPDDANTRSISPGDRVRVFNDRGEFILPARIDAGIRKGCVAVPNGWWGEEGGPVNLTSRGRETDMAHGAAFHDNLVEVEPAGRGEGGRG
jgi:anaerobic selenocysteine-containing dehydrogenase